MKKYAVLSIIILISSCGALLKGPNKWSESDVTSLGIRSNCVSGNENACQCIINKIEEKYPDPIDLSFDLKNPDKQKEFLKYIRDEVITECKKLLPNSSPSNSPSQPQSPDNLVFKSGVQGACNNNFAGQGLVREGLRPSRTYKIKAIKCVELVSSKFDSDNLTVVVKQNAFCNSKFYLSSTISDGKIMLKADDTSNEAVRCMCNFDLTYTFSGAKNSSYQLDYSGKVFNNEPCTSTFEVK